MTKIIFAAFALVCSLRLSRSLIYDTPLQLQSDDYFITKGTVRTHFRGEFLKLIKTQKTEHPRYKEQYAVAAGLLELMNLVRYMDDVGAILEITLSEVAQAFLSVTGADYVDLIYQKLVDKLKKNPPLYDEYVRADKQRKPELDGKAGKRADDGPNPVWVRAVLSNCFLMESKKPVLSNTTRYKTRRERIIVAHLVVTLAADAVRGADLQQLYEGVIAEVAKNYEKAYSIKTDEAAKVVLEKLKLKLEADPKFSQDLREALEKWGQDAAKKL